MRALKSLIGMATLALTASLVGCGGGGDAGDRLTPLPDGSLTISNATNAALNGTFTAEDAVNTNVVNNTTDGTYDVTINRSDSTQQSDSPQVFLKFSTTTGALTYAEYNVDGNDVYYCNDVTSGRQCAVANVSIDTSAHTITFNRSTLSLDGNLTIQLTLTGVLHWENPA